MNIAWEKAKDEVLRENTAQAIQEQLERVCNLCLPEMLSGANAFKISDLQEAETGSIASQAIRM